MNTDPPLAGRVFPPPAVSSESAPLLAAQAAQLGVATIVAASSIERVVPAGRLPRIAGRGAIAGWAVTIWNPSGSNTALRLGIPTCRPGDVIVVATPDDGAAQWGELAHEWAIARQAAGVVVDGSVRDVAAIRQLGLPLWARGVDPRSAKRTDIGYVNGPIEVAGVGIEPGELVVADDDGIAVLSRDELDEALAAAVRRVEREHHVREATRGGTPWPISQDLAGAITTMDHPWTSR